MQSSNSQNNLETYETHDNGGTPFDVVINRQNNEVKVYLNEYDDDYEKTYRELIHTFTPKEIFVGKSPINQMTKFSGGHGIRFDGNSILLHLSDVNYVFIGQNIFSFQAYHKIVKYVSPVGNNDVPYPFAVDENGYYYLMIEDVVIANVPDEFDGTDDDPYEFYYRYLSQMSEDLGYIPSTKPKYNIYIESQTGKIDGKTKVILSTMKSAKELASHNDIDDRERIEKFYIDDDQYTFKYKRDGGYEYDRLTKPDPELVDSLDKKLYIVSNKDIKYELTRDGMIKLMDMTSHVMGIYKMIDKKILTERQW